MSDDPLVTIVTLTDMASAQVVQDRLKAAGIESTVDQQTLLMVGSVPLPVPMVRVQVRASRVEAAAAALREEPPVEHPPELPDEG
jgi:hypothetical protein